MTFSSRPLFACLQADLNTASHWHHRQSKGLLKGRKTIKTATVGGHLPSARKSSGSCDWPRPSGPLYSSRPSGESARNSRDRWEWKQGLRGGNQA